MVLLSSCKPLTEVVGKAVQETLAALPTSTPLATLTSYPTFTPQATFTKLPTYTLAPTYTALPSQAPTATLTPTEAWTPTPEGPPTNTPDLLTVEHPPGIYLVGVDIAPGIWRSQNTGSTDCYWEITDQYGETLDNHFGQSGGTMYINPWAFQVELEPACGTWVYLGLTR